MKNLLLFLVLLAAGCAGVQKAPPVQTMTIKEVVEASGLTKEQVFNKTNQWIVQYLRQEGADSGTGVIMASGEVEYPSPGPDRLGYTIGFIMKNEIQDGANEVTFDKIMLRYPRQYISEASTVQPFAEEEIPIVSGKDADVARKALVRITGHLDNHLND